MWRSLPQAIASFWKSLLSSLASAPSSPNSPDAFHWSVLRLTEAFRRREVSPVEVAQAALHRAAALGATINPFVRLLEADALAAALASEARWRAGTPLGPLDGVPVAVKDLLLTKGHPTLRGSLTVDPEQAWVEDAPAVARLKEAGAVILGKTTTSEFGWKGLSDSPLTGITRNPWHRSHTAGGSSGGAAAAGRLGIGAIQIGTDGGGSGRLPAAYSGIIGFKPTFGVLPVYPSAHTGTLFHLAPMARSVADLAVALAVLGRPDARDWHAVPSAFDWRTSSVSGRLDGVSVAYCPRLFGGFPDPQIEASVAAAVDRIAGLGAHVEKRAPEFGDPARIFRTLWFSAAARLIDSVPVSRRSSIEAGLRLIAEEGRGIDLAAVQNAVAEREAFGRRLALFHRHWDLIVTPTISAPAPRVDDPDVPMSPSPFTYPFNLSQQPALSLPCGVTHDGLPIGIQIVGAKYRDDLVIQAAAALEAELQFEGRYGRNPQYETPVFRAEASTAD